MTRNPTMNRRRPKGVPIRAARDLSWQGNPAIRAVLHGAPFACACAVALLAVAGLAQARPPAELIDANAGRPSTAATAALGGPTRTAQRSRTNPARFPIVPAGALVRPPALSGTRMASRPAVAAQDGRVPAIAVAPPLAQRPETADALRGSSAAVHAAAQPRPVQRPPALQAPAQRQTAAVGPPLRPGALPRQAATALEATPGSTAHQLDLAPAAKGTAAHESSRPQHSSPAAPD